jgi:hypothetical protein
MGGADVPRPLDDLYARVDSGIVRLTSTHQVPLLDGPEGEGGDTTGGLRSDFRTRSSSASCIRMRPDAPRQRFNCRTT